MCRKTVCMVGVRIVDYPNPATLNHQHATIPADFTETHFPLCRNSVIPASPEQPG